VIRKTQSYSDLNASLLPSNRQHSEINDCLDDKGKIIRTTITIIGLYIHNYNRQFLGLQFWV